jgi:dihydroxyacetone kinase
VDALAPAVAELARGGTFAQAARAAAEGARGTAELLARRGRASYVGDRARGVPDPGAVGVALLFQALAAGD